MIRDHKFQAVVTFILNLLVVLLLLAGCTFQITPQPEGAATMTPEAEAEDAGAAETPTAAAEEEAAEGEETATPVAEEEGAATETPAAEEEATPEETGTATPAAEEEAGTEAGTATPAAEEEGAAEGTPTPAAEEEAATSDTGGKQFVYVGTYTRSAPGGWSDAAEQSHPEGVAVFEFDPTTGEMTLIQTVPSDNPSFVALHPSQDYLYVVNEIDDYEGQEAGSIEAYAIDAATGELTLLNRQPIGTIPAHLAVDPTGSYVVVANYVGANFDLLPIQDDGSLGEVVDSVMQSGSGPTDRQEAPHPHAVVFDPSGSYIAAADLGTDQVLIFQIQDDQLMQVDEVMVAAGSGPRHVAFHPSGDYLYVINELNATISVFPFDSATGQLGEEQQTIGTVPDDFPAEKSTAEIMVHPSGKFLYGSNRKAAEHPLADAIVAYSIDEATGELTLIGHATEGIQYPRAFNFDPSGRWLYALNQKGDTMVQFEIDQETGELTPTGVVIDTPVPVAIVFKTE